MPAVSRRLYGAGGVLLPGVLGGAVDVVGAGRITKGRSPGLTSPYFSRASRSISESVLSRFDSRAGFAFIGLQDRELGAGLVGLRPLVEEGAGRVHEREQQADEHNEEQRDETHRRSSAHPWLT